MKVCSFQPLFTKGGFTVHNCSFPVTSCSRSHRYRSVGPRYRKSWGVFLKILTGLKLMTSWTIACLQYNLANSTDTADPWLFSTNTKSMSSNLQGTMYAHISQHNNLPRGGFAKPSKFVPGCSELTRVAIWGLKNNKMNVSEGKCL